jgi:hypothetical protein
VAGEESLPTYTIGDTVRLPLELRDESGVAQCYAHFSLMADPEDPTSTDINIDFELEGDGEGLTDGTVELTEELTNAPPGIYWCDWIQVFDTVRNKTEIDDPGIRLRVVEKPGADYEPPEIVNVRPLN